MGGPVVVNTFLKGLEQKNVGWLVCEKRPRDIFDAIEKTREGLANYHTFAQKSVKPTRRVQFHDTDVQEQPSWQEQLPYPNLNPLPTSIPTIRQVSGPSRPDRVQKVEENVAALQGDFTQLKVSTSTELSTLGNKIDALGVSVGTSLSQILSVGNSLS